MSYEEKYLKYKLKYINLKEYKNYLDNLDKNETNILSHNEFINQTGGALPCLFYKTKRCKEKKRKMEKIAAEREQIRKREAWRKRQAARQAPEQDVREAARKAAEQAARQTGALLQQSIYEFTDADAFRQGRGYITMKPDERYASVIDDGSVYESLNNPGTEYETVPNPERFQENFSSGNIYGSTSDGYNPDNSLPYGFGLEDNYSYSYT